jgi:hypothetical protein
LSRDVEVVQRELDPGREPVEFVFVGVGDPVVDEARPREVGIRVRQRLTERAVPDQHLPHDAVALHVRTAFRRRVARIRDRRAVAGHQSAQRRGVEAINSDAVAQRTGHRVHRRFRRFALRASRLPGGELGPHEIGAVSALVEAG